MNQAAIATVNTPTANTAAPAGIPAGRAECPSANADDRSASGGELSRANLVGVTMLLRCRGAVAEIRRLHPASRSSCPASIDRAVAHPGDGSSPDR